MGDPLLNVALVMLVPSVLAVALCLAYSAGQAVMRLLSRTVKR